MRLHLLIPLLLAVLAGLRDPRPASATTSPDPASAASLSGQGRGGGGRIRVRGGRSAKAKDRNPRAGRNARPSETPQMPPEELERARVYFLASDRDGNGWIGLNEGMAALELDRRRFAQFDRNQDGRISLQEFERAYRNAWERIGAFPPPIVEPGSEGERLLAELAHDSARAEEGVEPDQEGAEDEGHDLLPHERRAHSIAELFGRPMPSNATEGSTPTPPRVRGPVPIFLRLDIDRDGAITTRDLDELSRPLQLPVARNAVFAILDRDENARIDPAELALALGGDPR